ncbi:MAG: DUF5688 family protein [Sphaerochaetaceae bacterium]|nr:DUF5688 family protein [Sphaerochaetaceae bacterium]
MNTNTLHDELYNLTAHKMKAEFGDKIEIQRTEAIKTNGLKDSMLVKLKDRQIGIPLYLSDFAEDVEQGATLEQVSNEMCNLYRKHLYDNVELPILDYGHAKENLYCVVVNKERNQNLIDTGTIYQEIPNTDLALIVRYKMDSTELGQASFVVKQNQLTYLQITEAEAIEFAKTNSCKDDYSIKSMGDIFREMGMPEEMLNDMNVDDMMYVVTNNDKLYGATGVFISKELREEVVSKVNCDKGVYIIPSSIHETIVVPAYLESENIKEMIKDVNASVVSDSDFLSDNLYYCDCKLNLHIASTELMEQLDQMEETVKIVDLCHSTMHM